MKKEDLFEDAEGAAPSKETALEPEPRIRTQLLDALHRFAVELGGDIDAPTLADLLAHSDPQIDATRRRVLDAISLALRGFTRAGVPGLDIQMHNFSTWQQNKGTYFLWPKDAMARLGEKLAELGEGVELLPCFAHSVGVRLQSGVVVFIDRAGNLKQKA